MPQKLNCPKVFLFAVTVLALSFSVPCLHAAGPDPFADVKKQLIKDGFDPEKINTIYKSESVGFTTQGIHLFFSTFKASEKKRNYAQFSNKTSMAKASAYLKTHAAILEKAQKQFQVDKTIIIAILLVETQLGTYPMKYLAVNMLSSLAALSDTQLKEKVWKAIAKKRKPSKGRFIKRAEEKRHWAYNELKALITYMHTNNLPAHSVKGSYAGAIGFCQFMPSNIPGYAADGNNDGKIDLMDHDDAIFSVARYFKKHGWKPGLSDKQQRNVIYRYNHDWHYVDAIQTISKKLTARQDKK
jgi:membrane-bound lytic murein transglycosylase B